MYVLAHPFEVVPIIDRILGIIGPMNFTIFFLFDFDLL